MAPTNSHPSPGASTSGSPTPQGLINLTKCQLCQNPTSGAPSPNPNSILSSDEILSLCKLLNLSPFEYSNFFLELYYCETCLMMIRHVHLSTSLLSLNKAHIWKLLVGNWGGIIPQQLWISGDGSPNEKDSGSESKQINAKSKLEASKKSCLVEDTPNGSVPAATDPIPNLDLEKQLKSLGNKCFWELFGESKKLAVKYGVEKKDIFPSAVIRALAAEMPDNPKDFLQVDNVAQENYEKYGSSFLQICERYAAQKYVLILDAQDSGVGGLDKGQTSSTSKAQGSGDAKGPGSKSSKNKKSTAGSKKEKSDQNVSDTPSTSAKPKRQRAKRTRKTIVDDSRKRNDRGSKDKPDLEPIEKKSRMSQDQNTTTIDEQSDSLESEPVNLVEVQLETSLSPSGADEVLTQPIDISPVPSLYQPSNSMDIECARSETTDTFDIPAYEYNGYSQDSGSSSSSEGKLYIDERTFEERQRAKALETVPCPRCLAEEQRTFPDSP